MKREILFRGKKGNGEWVEGSLLMSNTECFIISINKRPIERSVNQWLINAPAFKVNNETACQLVKNVTYYGKTFKIFNGDIVRLMQPYSDDIFLAEIYFDEFCCAYRAKIHKRNGIFIDNLTVLTIIEVAGNIFDNPELLIQ